MKQIMKYYFIHFNRSCEKQTLHIQIVILLKISSKKYQQSNIFKIIYKNNVNN
jgi:hypothetical protein